MSVNVTFNGAVYIIPETGEVGWGGNVTSYLIALAAGALQKTGGSFTLSSEVDFGASFGIESLYYKSRTANISSTGIIRLANTSDAISWRNFANSADIPLAVNASDQLTFNGVPLAGAVAFAPNRVIISDGSGFIAASTVTSTELGYLSGVTSSIQTQLNGVVHLAGSETITGQKTFDSPLLSSLGSASLPGYSFTGDTNTGIYSSSADTVNIAVGGNERFRIDASQVFLLNDGSASAPAFSWQTDSNTGIYRVGADNFAFATNGSERMRITDTEIQPTVRILETAGSLSVPSYSFSADTDTGLYSFAGNHIGITTGGTLAVIIDNAQRFQIVDGSAANPALTFINDIDTGMYSGGANDLRFATGGILGLLLDTAQRIRGVDGSVSFPTFSFINDPDTGMYRDSSNVLRLVTGGVPAITIGSAQTVSISNTKLQIDGNQVYPNVETTRLATGTITTTSSTTFVNTAVTITITPKFSTSKIKISVSGAIAGALPALDLARNGTDLSGNTFGFTYTTGSTTVPAAIVYYDSPATTSAVTYTVRLLSIAGSPASFPAVGSTAVMIVEELAQ